ncbi:MAG: galactose-1-phosphate uridylyltransferase [Campylobacterales bacterium]|nr:galactose-1-phosphate uridylyltransferase [Campylobacterales bacterium]
MSEIRLDRIRNQYILIAPERLHRPDTHRPPRVRAGGYRCPFCEGNEALTPPEIFALRDNAANAAGWKMRVVPNLYKAVQVELEDRSKRDGMFESIPGVGAHEVVIDSPCHDCNLHQLDKSAIENWLRTLMRRIDDLRNDKRLIYISIFKNHGANAGATQEHPHTQILALPVMPREELEFLARNHGYYRRHGRGKIHDIIDGELKEKVRIIEEIGCFVAFCPYASHFPFEVMITPRRRNIISLSECHRDDIAELSALLRSVFIKLSHQLGDFDYNLYISQAPLNANFENEEYLPHLHKNYRFTIRITPRIYRIGGFEIATQMAINPVAPEECASLLNMRE